MAMTRPAVTVFDLAQTCLRVHAGKDYRDHVDFLDDAGRRQAMFANDPVLALALDLVGDILDETLTAGFGCLDLDALLAEARRRACEPAALDRLRQRLARVVN
jgi:hypothetical protein